MDSLTIFHLNYMKHVIIGITHCVFYTFLILPIILINAETWFFGTKFSGMEAVILHFLIGVVGIVLGYLIYKKQKYALWMGLGMAIFYMIGIFINHLTV